MPLTPFFVYGTMTKLDGSARTNVQVWLIDETTNEQQVTSTDSSGNYIFDCANFNSYSNGDNISVAVEAYDSNAYHLTREPFDDSSVDDIEYGNQRLNNATCTVNFKII